MAYLNVRFNWYSMAVKSLGYWSQTTGPAFEYRTAKNWYRSIFPSYGLCSPKISLLFLIVKEDADSLTQFLQLN